MISVSANPIVSWPLFVIGALAVIAATVWAYLPRIKESGGKWPYIALVVRILAVLTCLLGAARPSVLWLEKKKQKSEVVVLIDTSTSMTITDEIRGQSRFAMAKKTLEAIGEASKKFANKFEVKYYGFDSALKDIAPDAKDLAPSGKETALGSMILEAVKRQQGKRVATMIVIGDGASNSGAPPLTAADRLKAQQVPVVAVGFGSETASSNSKDIAARTIEAGPTVFVKNELRVRGTLGVRGFANQDLDVELYIDDDPKPAAVKRVRAEEGKDIIPVDGLKYIPETTGEKKVTIKVKKHEGELVAGNNEISTYVSVLKGGLSVLHLQGSKGAWESLFLTRALDSSPDIQVDLKIVRSPVGAPGAEPLPDTDFAPGRYDAFILGDIAADRLTTVQQRLLAECVRQGAGLIMLGGRSSFGPGGWGETELAKVLPVDMNPADSQIEPEGGLKVIPLNQSMQSYIMQLGAVPKDSERIWAELPPLSGANRLGKAKRLAQVLAQSPDRDPLMVIEDVGKGRTMAFGGETWVWARKSEETRAAHRKFWRQVILWATHKENQGDSRVRIVLDRRRLPLGQKLDITVSARNERDEPIAGAKFETTVTRLLKGGSDKPEKIELYAGETESRGPYFANGKAGEYRVDVKGTAPDGKPLGADSARFLVYEDDRELENPAADLALLKQIASVTGGVMLPPEMIGKQLAALEKETPAEYRTPTERRLWDNWPFLIIFAALFTLEWVIRKSKGWV